MANRQYSETLQYLFGLEVFGIRPGLESISNLLARIDDPHRHLKVVHIAGTSGKGSVAVFLHAILQEAGYHVGLYTSPHVVDFTERIVAGRQCIPAEDVIRLTEWLRGKSEGLVCTFFEFITAMAFAYFREQKTDVVVCEVGMGGRLDATNVVTPLVSVITSISRDHTEYLGRKLRDIAFEKGGIIKPGIPAVTTATIPSVISVLEAICRENASPLWRMNREFRICGKSRKDFSYIGPSLRLRHLETGMAGHYQMTNAAAALAATEILSGMGFSISEGHIRQGLREAFLLGRLQVVRQNPTVVLDGAHNPGKARQLARALREEFASPSVHLVLGIMRDKDVAGVLRHLAPLTKRIFLVRPRGERAADPETLKAMVEKLGCAATVAGDVPLGIRMALDSAHPEDLICVCGSFYTVSEAMKSKIWETPPQEMAFSLRNGHSTPCSPRA